jgi:hypothetical protein
LHRASDNYWNDGSYGSLSYRLSGQTANIQYWYFRGIDSNQPYGIYVFAPNKIYGRALPLAGVNVGSQCMDWIGDDANNPTALRERKLGKILRNENQYQALQTEFTLYDQEYFYTEFEDDSSLLYLGGTDDEDYQAMYTQMKNSNFGKFADARKLIDEGDFDNAELKVNSINPQHLIEQNRKTATKIYLQSFAKDRALDPLQREQLMDIALMTPYIGGDAVYSARVMLGIDPDDYGVAYKFAQPEIIEKTSETVLVYPNPLKDEITIRFVNGISSIGADFRVFDLLGNLVFSSKLENDITKLKIENINAGIYVYSIFVEKSCIRKEKLIIVK